MSRTTHYSVKQQRPGSSILFVFAGWDDSSQSNKFDILQMLDAPTGRKDDENRPITEPVLRWSRPHRTGSVPRPRNDVALIPIDDNTLLTFGGWNGRNYVDDCEIVTFRSELATDPLGALLDDVHFQQQIFDIVLEFAEARELKLSRVVLFSRCEHFRNLLIANPSLSKIDLLTISCVSFISMVPGPFA